MEKGHIIKQNLSADFMDILTVQVAAFMGLFIRYECRFNSIPVYEMEQVLYYLLPNTIMTLLVFAVAKIVPKCVASCQYQRTGEYYSGLQRHVLYSDSSGCCVKAGHSPFFLFYLLFCHGAWSELYQIFLSDLRIFERKSYRSIKGWKKAN